MKQIFTTILLFVFALGVKAQQANNQPSLHYYFGNEKIYLKQSNEKLYLRIPASEISEVKTALRNNYQITEKSFSTLQNNGVLLIDLKESNNSSRANAVISFLKTNNNLELIRPALIANDGKDVVIDEGFYVKLKPNTSYRQLIALAAQNNCIVEKQYQYDNKTFLLKAGSGNGYDGLRMANLFFETGLFVFSEPDFRLLDGLHAVPNDPLYNLQWSAVNTGAANQGSGTAGADMDIDEAWDITMGSPTIKIAVIDEGVQRSHPDLINNITATGFGLVAANATTGNILANTRSHGTSCAGIIAAEANNNIGMAGVAPLSKLIPINITVNTSGTFGTSAQLAQAIDWAWNEGGADVLSNSWGGGTASSLIRDAISRAITLGRAGKGAIVIFSSGNNNAGVTSPAIFPETIAVGAMSMCNQRKSGSSCDGETFWGACYGTGLDIAAPGVRIATTRVTGTGVAPNPDYTLSFNGTSSAAPMVAGVAALVLSINNNFTQTQVREILERSTKKVGAYTYTNVMGQPNGSWTSELGHGMVNAKNAVLAAQNPLFCRVDIAATGSLQVCTGSLVALLVTNNIAGNNYQWRRDGNIVGTGINLSANQTGNYDVVLTTSTGCKDTSYALPITVSAAQGALVANAGRDTSICVDSKIFLGGSPSASGGTGIIHPMRAMGADLSNNYFLRFDPSQPSLNYRIVKEAFLPTGSNEEFCAGAAATPSGLFMLTRLSKELVKVDTATGDIYPVGIVTANAVSFNAMTYDPVGNKTYASASSGSLNQLYEINLVTGVGTLLGSITGIASSTILISLSADNSGQLFGLKLSNTLNVSAQLMTINKTTLLASPVGNTGFLAFYAQSGDVDPLTDELYQAANTSVLGSTANFNGNGLWKLNKTTGFATLAGAIAVPYNVVDALSFANKEYKYQWSPATNLSNAKDANPQFTATANGTYTYTLTVTDLCGNTATDQVTIFVNAAPPIASISPANPVLSHRNSFRDTLNYTQAGGLDYTWVKDGLPLGNTSPNLPISFDDSQLSQFHVRTTNPITGCVSNSSPVLFTYATGVLLNNNTALTVCDTSFYDFGGPTGLTGNNFSRTFTPATPGSKLTLTFYNLNFAQSATLFVYDGPDASSPRIEALNNSFNGTTVRTFTASNPDGVLTIRFSIGTVASSGWLAGLTCEQGLQFRTIGHNNWTTQAIWESKLPSAQNYTAATRLPNKGDDLIEVRHNVLVTTPLQIDDVIVTGRLQVSGAGSINLYKVKPASEIIVQAGGNLDVLNNRQVFGGRIEMKGNLENSGAINVQELIFNGNTAQQLNNSSGLATSITKLTMNNAAGLTVQGLHNIQTLELTSGLINTSTDNTIRFEFASGGSISSFVNGVVRFLIPSGRVVNIPIGKSGVYRPLVLSASSANGEGSALMQAEVITGAPTTRTFPSGISNVSNIRYYRASVLENGSNVRDFTITLPYGADDGVTDHNVLKIAKDNGTTAWLNLGGTATGAASGSITSDEFNSFSDFVLANVAGAPLPVTLISFSGRLQNSQALLNWSAENQINFARYEIERSRNGTNFSSIGFVNAQGSPPTMHYNFVDDQLPASALIFYRLKMVDIDGQHRYSNIIKLKKEAIEQSRLVLLAPNPFTKALTVHFESAVTEKIEVHIFNSKGQLLKLINFEVTEGINQLYIDSKELPAGIYLLRLKTKTQVITQRIIKQ